MNMGDNRTRVQAHQSCCWLQLEDLSSVIFLERDEVWKSRSVMLDCWRNFDDIKILTVEPFHALDDQTHTHTHTHTHSHTRTHTHTHSQTHRFDVLFYHFRPITAPSVFVAPALRSSDTSNRKSLRIQILVITNWIVLRRVKKSWLSSPPACGSELASLYYVIFYSQLLFILVSSSGISMRRSDSQ